VNAAVGYLAAERERLGLDRLGVRERPACVIVTPRFRESRHVVILLLAPDARRPVLVAKLPRLPVCDRALAREARNLRALENVQSELDEGSVPALVAFEEDGHYPLLLETALTGEPLSPAAIRRDPAGALTAAPGWLERLGAATRGEADGAWYDRLVNAPLHSLAARATDPRVRELVAQTLDLAEALRSARMPLVFEHGDFGHPNLLRRPGGRLGVLDWERGDPAGLPAQDLFFFLAHAALAGARHRREEMLHAAFFGSQPWAWKIAERYARRLAFETELLGPLLAVCCGRALERVGSERMMPLWRRVLGGAT
jgi:aminoglycoside phosphotransferase (APT) family kinase protein